MVSTDHIAPSNRWLQNKVPILADVEIKDAGKRMLYFRDRLCPTLISYSSCTFLLS